MPLPLILFKSSYSFFDTVGLWVDLKLLSEVDVLKLARSAIKLGDRIEADTRPGFVVVVWTSAVFDGSLTIIFKELFN